MSVLDITKDRAKQFEKLEEVAVNILLEYLGDKRPGGDDINVAIKSLNMVAKNRVTTTARDALKFSMAKTITDDPKLLRKYIKASQPEIKKLIG